MPVIGSSRVLSWDMVHDGVIRRSEEELGDTTKRGTSGAVWSAMAAADESRERYALEDFHEGRVLILE